MERSCIRPSVKSLFLSFPKSMQYFLVKFKRSPREHFFLLRIPFQNGSMTDDSPLYTSVQREMPNSFTAKTTKPYFGFRASLCSRNIRGVNIGAQQETFQQTGSIFNQAEIIEASQLFVNIHINAIENVHLYCISFPVIQGFTWIKTGLFGR